jgi:L-ribulose-5-phosphate 4-epimerase
MEAIDQLKKDVLAANQELPKLGLVLYSWGNVSGIDRKRGIVVIKPVGIPYSQLTPDIMSVTDLKGNILSGPHNPSVDLPIHLELYHRFLEISAITHTHSTYATMWAQAQCAIPCYGTTHADYFYGEVPCTRSYKMEDTGPEFEAVTGKMIAEIFQNRDPLKVPGVLVADHGPFTWGDNPWDAVHKSAVLEEIAKVALGSLQLNPAKQSVPQFLLDRHFLRKHGENAYFENDDLGEKNG